MSKKHEVRTKCPGDPNHRGYRLAYSAPDGSPRAMILCQECGIFIKWASRTDIFMLSGIDMSDLDKAASKPRGIWEKLEKELTK